ncbi:MAG: hypothetical protein HQ579_01220, partial [Candidatus Omnitrophica bacterium]|nr:hypothetical protein [Candidatus Omnitrophota bacterium]
MFDQAESAYLKPKLDQDFHWENVHTENVKTALYPASGVDSSIVLETLTQIPTIEDVYLVDLADQDMETLEQIISQIVDSVKHDKRFSKVSCGENLKLVKTNPEFNEGMEYFVRIKKMQSGATYGITMTEEKTKREIRLHFCYDNYFRQKNHLRNISDLTIVKFPGMSGILSSDKKYRQQFYDNIFAHTRPGGYIYVTMAQPPHYDMFSEQAEIVATNCSPGTIRKLKTSAIPSPNDRFNPDDSREGNLAMDKYILFRMKEATTGAKPTDHGRGGATEEEAIAELKRIEPELQKPYSVLNDRLLVRKALWHYYRLTGDKIKIDDLAAVGIKFIVGSPSQKWPSFWVWNGAKIGQHLGMNVYTRLGTPKEEKDATEKDLLHELLAILDFTPHKLNRILANRPLSLFIRKFIYKRYIDKYAEPSDFAARAGTDGRLTIKTDRPREENASADPASELTPTERSRRDFTNWTLGAKDHSMDQDRNTCKVIPTEKTVTKGELEATEKLLKHTIPYLTNITPRTLAYYVPFLRYRADVKYCEGVPDYVEALINQDDERHDSFKDEKEYAVKKCIEPSWWARQARGTKPIRTGTRDQMKDYIDKLVEHKIASNDKRITIQVFGPGMGEAKEIIQTLELLEGAITDPENWNIVIFAYDIQLECLLLTEVFLLNSKFRFNKIMLHFRYCNLKDEEQYDYMFGGKKRDIILYRRTVGAARFPDKRPEFRRMLLNNLTPQGFLVYDNYTIEEVVRNTPDLRSSQAVQPAAAARADKSVPLFPDFKKGAVIE